MTGSSALPRFGVVDVETSGLKIRRHRILQIGVVVVEDGSVIDQWSTFVGLRWPLQRVGPRRIHGLSRATLRGAPGMREVLTELAGRLDGTVFTAHNAAFDAEFLERAARRAGVALRLAPRLCTLRMSRRLDPERSLTHGLADLCERYSVPLERPHDALCDALATAAVLPHLLAAHGVATGDDLDALYDRSSTPPSTPPSTPRSDAVLAADTSEAPRRAGEAHALYDRP